MDINQIQANLELLKANGTLIDARFLTAGNSDIPTFMVEGKRHSRKSTILGWIEAQEGGR